MSDPTTDVRVQPGPRNPKAVGEISEAIVLARLVELGYAVSLPFGNNQRYDLIVEDGAQLVRAQVKTGRLRSGHIRFSTRSYNGFTREKRCYLGEADDFLVYCPETAEVYRVPVTDCTMSGHGSLRVAPLQEGRGHNRPVRLWAEDYVLAEPGVSTRPGKRARGVFKACATVHPGVDSRVVTALRPDGSKRRRYCQECYRVWAKDARARKRANAAS